MSVQNSHRNQLNQPLEGEGLLTVVVVVGAIVVVVRAAVVVVVGASVVVVFGATVVVGDPAIVTTEVALSIIFPCLL